MLHVTIWGQYPFFKKFFFHVVLSINAIMGCSVVFPTTLQLVTKVLEKSPIFGHVLNGYKYHNWGLGYTFIDDLKNVVIVRLTRRYSMYYFRYYKYYCNSLTWLNYELPTINALITYSSTTFGIKSNTEL